MRALDSGLIMVANLMAAGVLLTFIRVDNMLSVIL